MAQPAKYIDKVITAPTDELISFDDYDRRRSMIFSSAKEAATQRFPLSNDKYELSLEDVGYDDGDKAYTLKEQKDAILGGRTLSKKLKARFVLKDVLTGKVLEKGSKKTIANIPYMTQRGTFIRNGNESVMLNQLRMVPGAYSRKTNNGKYETLVNVKQGTGTQFKMQLDPATAQFNFRAGGRKIAAYPVMKAMGITDEQLEASWGKDILAKNKTNNDTRAVNSAYEVFVPEYKKVGVSV